MIKEALAQKTDEEIQLLFEQELNEFLGKLAQMLGKKALKKGAETGLKNVAKSSLKDKALQYGTSALDFMSGGADEEDDGSWSSKLSNWGSTAGSLAGSIGAGALGSVVPGAGTVVGGLAGGAAGGFLGRKVGKTLGSIIDMFSGGNKAGAVKQLAKMIAAGAIPAYGLAKFSGSLDDNDSDTYSDLLSATKEQVPDKYQDDIENAIQATDEESDL